MDLKDCKKMGYHMHYEGESADPMLFVKIEAVNALPKWTWWVSEYDEKTGDCYGIAKGLELEAGYFNIREIFQTPGLIVLQDKNYAPETFSQLLNREKNN